MTGMATTERKNTACPGGTMTAVTLIIEIMVMKTITEINFKEIVFKRLHERIPTALCRGWINALFESGIQDPTQLIMKSQMAV